MEKNEAMDDVLRVRLEAALRMSGMAAVDLAREIGLDKAYFADFLAGRKKSVTANAFMLAAKRLGQDPWYMAGLSDASATDGDEQYGTEHEPLPDSDPPPTPIIDIGGQKQDGISSDLLRLSGLVEERAYRQTEAKTDAGPDEPSFALMKSHPASRQSVFLVRGDDYSSWGVHDGVAVHVVSFARYETVAGKGRLLLQRRDIGRGLAETTLRRVSIDGDGLMFLDAPDGSRNPFPDPDCTVIGIVMQETSPAV